MSQSDISPPWPPLFVMLFSHEAHRVDALLTDDSPFRVSDPKLRWNCVAQAPNGRQEVGIISFPDGAGTPYDQIVSLFSVKAPVELWFAPGGKDDVIRDRIHEAKDASIALWADGGGQSTLDNFRFFQPDKQPYWLAPEVGAEPNFVIETKDSEGRPSFAGMRASDRLMVEAAKADAAVPFLLRVTSPIGDHTAYWNFFRHGHFEAAYHVGRRIISRLPTSPSDARTACDATTLAAAHAILRFGDLWEEAEPLVRSALTALEDNLDANMMLWVFCFERGDSEELCRSRLREVLVQVQQRAPIFTETFRLFYERMSSFSPLCNLANDADLKGGVEHVEHLMAASFLRNERLVYRGRSPKYPDANAPASAGSAQKKSFLKEVKAAWFAINPLMTTEFVPQKNLLTHAPSTASAALELPISANDPAVKSGSNSPIPAPSASDKKGTPQRQNETWPPANVRSVAQVHARQTPVHERQAKPSGRKNEPPIDDKELVDRLVHINRVAKVVKGGRRFGFAALVVVGDQKGWVGFGQGKAREVPEAIRKATEAAKRAMISVPLREGRTLHHDVKGHHGAGRVLLRSAPAGTGIIAGGPMRAIFETLGIHDVVAKSQGTSNPYNMVRATFEALAVQESPREVAARRNLKVSALVPRSRSRSEAVTDREYATF